LFALLVSATPAFAVATTKYALTNSGWTDLGAGPMLLSFQGSGVFAVGDTTPTLVNEGFGIRAGRSFPIKTTSHVWAKAPGAFSVNAYVAPISAGGGGPLSCAQATTHLARTVGNNEGGNAVNISNLICGLVVDGVIDGDLSPIVSGKPAGKTLPGCGSHLDTLYVYAQQNGIDAMLNICGTNYTGGNAGTVAFTSYVGLNGYNLGGITYSNFNPTTATSPHFTLNNGSFGVWAYDAFSDPKPQMGNGNTYLYDNAPNFYPRVNDSNPANVTTTITKGLFVAERRDAANVYGYQNGVSSAAMAAASTGVTNDMFYIGGINGVAYTAQTLSEVHIGGALGDTLNLALYNRLRTYMTAVGVP
jgi:hypothetical protein